MTPYLKSLESAIERTFECRAIHVKTVPVEEFFRGKIAWEGEVEVFKFLHPKTGKVCYAWGVEGEAKGLEITMVLHEPPICGPQDAVKASIAREATARKGG